jgi:hypothetical protein
VSTVTHTIAASRVFVDAPDGPAALALEQRLAHLAPVAIAHGNQWVVEFETVEDLSVLEASVRSWLREVGAAETYMRVDGREMHVGSSMFKRHRHRSPNSDFIG